MRELFFGMAVYTGASILGPLFVLGGAGYLLDQHFDKYPLYTLIGLAIAFVLTNVFLFKKVVRLTKAMNDYAKEAEKEKASKEIEENKEEEID